MVWLGVVPPLKSELRDQRLESLASSADRYSGRIAARIGTSAPAAKVDAEVKGASDASGDRVTLLGITRVTQGDRRTLKSWVQSDSNFSGEIPDLTFAVGLDAARTGRPVAGTEPGAEGPIAEAAKPLFFRRRNGRQVLGSVVVFSTPLTDIDENAAIVSRRILIFGGLAFVVATLAGWLVARQLTRRIRAMERTARRVASGDFSQRFAAGGGDELGRLARALDDMQGQLAELERARRGFIATASHELRTPIFSLGGFLELLEDEELSDDERAQFFAQLREQVDRLGKLTTDLLDLSRLEAGSLELRPEPTDVGRLAHDVAAEFTPTLAAHDSHLELRTGANELEVNCDPERVAQILRILLDNALSHTPRGTDLVVAAARRDGRVRLTVTDFGSGIKRADMPRIFEPFFSADAARGSGLGLTIAHELAERMAGDLSAESRPGRTTFMLELPS